MIESLIYEIKMPLTFDNGCRFVVFYFPLIKVGYAWGNGHQLWNKKFSYGWWFNFLARFLLLCVKMIVKNKKIVSKF